jgi:hypothetical protein
VNFAFIASPENSISYVNGPDFLAQAPPPAKM